MGNVEPGSDAVEFGLSMLAGGLSNLISSSILNPFDVTKIRMQVQPKSGDIMYRGLAHTARRIVHEEGLWSLWKHGLVATWIREMLYSSLRFAIYAPLKRSLQTVVVRQDVQSGGEPFILKFLSGILAGVIGSIAANPTDLIKIRLQTEAGRVRDGVYVSGLFKGQKPSYNGTFDAFVKVFKQEGITGMYRGVSATLLRAGLLTGAQLASYDEAKYFLKKRGIMEEGVALHVSASLVAGVMATTASAPADVLKTRMLSQSETDPNRYRGMMDCFVKSVKNDGPFILFRGWLPSYLRLAPHFIIVFPMYEQIRKVMGLGSF